MQCMQEGHLCKTWGFVDGTVRPISRPGQNQRVVYNETSFVTSVLAFSLISQVRQFLSRPFQA